MILPPELEELFSANYEDRAFIEFYEQNIDMFEGKTDKEKEDAILDLVAKGVINVHIAIQLAMKEGLDLDE